MSLSRIGIWKLCQGQSRIVGAGALVAARLGESIAGGHKGQYISNKTKGGEKSQREINSEIL